MRLVVHSTQWVRAYWPENEKVPRPPLTLPISITMNTHSYTPISGIQKNDTKAIGHLHRNTTVYQHREKHYINGLLYTTEYNKSNSICCNIIL